MNATPNLAASVMARLLTRAKLQGDDYQLLVTAYAFERLLYRLGRSSVRDRVVLKGAMLLRLWSAQPYRATRDLDLLRRGEATFDAIREALDAILATPVPDDGLTFDAAGLMLQPMQADDEYTGTRAILPARCGNARDGHGGEARSARGARRSQQPHQGLLRPPLPGHDVRLRSA